MNPSWVIRTGRLIMRPVNGADLPDLIALKRDARIYAVMLGGVRTPAQTAQDLAEDIRFWGEHGVGMWTVRMPDNESFIGYVGLHLRPDDRGMALRFVLVAGAQGRGLASEAAGAALRFGHERAGLARIIAVARASNIASRQVLGAIGMVPAESYERGGEQILVFESVLPSAI